MNEIILKEKDPLSEYLFNFIKTFSYFRKVEPWALKSLVFQMKMTCYSNRNILEYRETSRKIYFLYSGKINQYVVWGDDRTLFNSYKPGFCFNMINAILSHESLFQYESEEKSVLFELDIGALEKTSKEYQLL